MTEGYDIGGLEAAAEQAIRACDGDPRAAVRALLVANLHLEAEIDRLTAALSRGFVRGRLKPDPPGASASAADAP